MTIPLGRIHTLLAHDPNGVRTIDLDDNVEVLRAPAESVAVHPVGDRFAYSVRDDAGTSLFVSDVDSAEGALVGQVLGDVEGLTWGPGIDSLTFVERRRDDFQTITLLDTRSGDVTTVDLLDEPHQAAEPSWSSDGDWLAIEAQTTVTLGPMTVYLVNREDRSVVVVDPQQGLTSQSAAPHFAPTSELLAYVYTGAGALVSEVRFFDVASGSRRTVDQRGLNAFRWSRDGSALLVASHDTVCTSGLVRVSSDTLEITRLLEGDGNMSPMYLDQDMAIFVRRPCDEADYVPTGTGALLALDLASGEIMTLAHHVFAGVPLHP